MGNNHVRLLFIAATVAVGAVSFGLLTYCMRLGRPMPSIGVVLIASPAVIVATWLFVQRGTPAISTFNLGNISYAATFGDLLFLTTVVGLTARQWQISSAAIPQMFSGRGWIAISFGAGLLYGLFTHYVMGGKPDSNSPHLGEQMHDSATSWVHNLGVTPAIAGAVFCMVIPLFFTPGARPAALVISAILVVGWGGLVVVDILRSQLDPSHPLFFSPQWLDVVMDWPHLRPRT